MEFAIEILKDLLLPKLEKDSNFKKENTNPLFWNSLVGALVFFDTNPNLSYELIIKLNLEKPEKINSKLVNIHKLFIAELAEIYVLGNNSETIDKLISSKNSLFLNEVSFLKNMELAIIESEKEKIISELPTYYKSLKLELVENNDTPVIPLFTYIKYAVAACLVLGLGFWFYNNQNQMVIPDNPVVTQPKEKDSSLELPKPVLVEATSSSKVTDVLINEGMGFSNSNNKIKLVSVNNSERIVSIQNAIDAYQKFIENELLTSPGNGPKNKNLLIEVEKEINGLSKELTELQTKQSSYLFDGKTLTIYDISPNAITIVAFDETYYIKNKNDFYTLIVASSLQKYNKVNDSTLKDNLKGILQANGKFE
jgi:hypothetical protein